MLSESLFTDRAAVALRNNQSVTSCSFAMKLLYFFGFFLIKATLAIPRMRVAPLECPLQDGNLLDVGLFATNEEECKELCASNAQCIFYHFYGNFHLLTFNVKNQT